MNWRDELNGACEVASLLSVAADRIADPEIRTALVATARTIDTRIKRGIVEVEAQLDWLIDPVNPR